LAPAGSSDEEPDAPHRHTRVKRRQRPVVHPTERTAGRARDGRAVAIGLRSTPTRVKTQTGLTGGGPNPPPTGRRDSARRILRKARLGVGAPCARHTGTPPPESLRLPPRGRWRACVLLDLLRSRCLTLWTSRIGQRRPRALL